jgi:tetratricopeptide (TPR) repeat protein
MNGNVVRRIIPCVLALPIAFHFASCASNPQKAKAKYFAEGQKYMKKGKYGDASVEFRNAVRMDPRFVEAYYGLAQADLAQRNWQGAYASLEKAIELDPGRIDARLDRGRLYLAARKYDNAVEEANSVLAKDPNNPGAYQLLGASLAGQRKADPALEAFTKVTQLLPDDASSFVNLALVEISLRRFPDAEKHLKQAVAADPKFLQASVDLAGLYRLQNKLLQAQEVLQAGILNNPDAPTLYIDWARMISSSGKNNEADGILDKLRNRMPKSPEASIAIGDYYVQRNDLNKSLAEYQRGLSVAPGNLELEKRMEELYLISNRTDEAAKLDAQLMKQAPKDLSVNITHGRLLLAQGKQQDAIIALQKASTNAADSAQAHYYLGVAYWQSNNLGQANNEFQAAIKAVPGFSLALRGLAQISLAQQHPAEAQEYAQELVQRFPAVVSNRLLLGEILLSEGQSTAAKEQFLAAGQLAPNLSAVHLDLGHVYAAEKKWTQAESEFETAVQVDPSDPNPLAPFADFLVLRQHAPKAVALLQRFVSANPNNSLGHMIFGALQFGLKNTSAAEAEFKRALELDPKSVQGYLGMGGVYQEEQKTDAAIGQYQKALELQPKSAPLVTMVGNLYLEKGELETARKYYAHALEVDSNFPIANANMAWVDAEEGKNLDVALGMAQKATAMLPDVPAVSDTLGWVMYKKGNYSGAIPLLTACVEKSPDSAQFHYHLGLALLAAGQKAPGQGHLQAALQMNKLSAPDKEQAQQALIRAN